MFKRFVTFLLMLTMCFSVTFISGCTFNGGDPIGGITTPEEEENEDGDEDDDEDDDDEDDEDGEVVYDPNKYAYSSNYTPTTFSKDSVSYEITHLGDGVRLIKNSYRLQNSSEVVVWAVETDLSKASINAGASLDLQGVPTKKVPYQLMTEWEQKNPTKKVMATTNADFFGAVSVNAFVMDGVIIKDSHNDNGVYDYANMTSDVPASAPMLFGIKGDVAQIAPMKKYTGDITDPAVKKPVIQSKLYYGGVLSGATVVHSISSNVIPYSTTDSIVFIDDTSSTYRARNRSIVFKLSLESSVFQGAEIVEKTTLTAHEDLTVEEGFALVVVHPDYAKISSAKKAEAGGTFSMSVMSEDGSWDGYTTMLGCRQALVINNAIPSTVALENTNGAQSTNIPRTAVGVINQNKVVLFAVEALTYGKLGTDADTKGLNLPQLADFIRYFGCSDAANFDGGGSTQLIVRDGLNGSGDAKVIVRSSDTASESLSSSRVVINSLLITTK